jgi:putative ABC transport system ATP-binding protein
MTSTATAATFLPQPRTHEAPLAAELRNVTRATHRRRQLQLLVDNVSIEFRRGQVTALLSRHDTSASAMLDLLDGRAEPTWGSVRVGGHEVTQLDRAELHQFRHRHVSRVWPGFGIQPKLTVRQNLRIAQRQSGRPADLAWIDRITDVLGLHGMLGYRTAPGAAERRARWAVARSLVGRPALVLVDDMTTRLAWADKPGLLDALRLAAAQLGVGVVIATREPLTASATDRVVLLTRGGVIDDTGDR